MSNDLIKGSLEDIQSLSKLDKEKLNHYCNMVFKDIKKTKGKANNVVVELGNKDGYKRELVEKRIRKNKYPTSKDKLKSIGLAKSNEKKFIEKINKGEINNTHVTNIAKADIDNTLSHLPPKKQENIIEKIIKNTDEKNLINREEIAAESIQNGNISLMIVENWYKGILRSSKQFESKLYINEEVLKFLSKEQIQELYEIVSQVAKSCDKFINSLNL